MQISTCLFLPTYPEAPGLKIIANAMVVASQLGAVLDAAVINADIPDVSNALSTLLLDLPAKIREAEAASRNRGKVLLQAVASEAAQHKVTLTTQELIAQPTMMGEAAAVEGRYFDLCMVGWARDGEVSRVVAEEVVFNSGRPTLILPDSESVGHLEHVVIAWDGSRVAARAVCDARPFLERAKAVSIVTVAGEKMISRQDSGERLAHGLRARGLQAKAESILVGQGPIGAVLQEHAARIGGKLLVMGGYGHSRFRDFVLGGATDDILSDLHMSVLMSH
jgi:nucleotide-binding universal stress UspA family protein